MNNGARKGPTIGSKLVQGAFVFTLLSEVVSLSRQDGVSYLLSLAGIIDLIFSTMLATALIVGVVRFFQWIKKKVTK